MALNCVHDPVIILGMSRSGTTLLATLLQQLGLFIGANFAEDLEASYFHGVNRTILKRVHGYWDNPAPMKYFLLNSAAVQDTVDCMERDLLSWRFSSYLGVAGYLRYRTALCVRQPWRWKDPQNVFTLPLWLRLFPRAKIVYIVRNGVDVAQSLRSMEQRVLQRRNARTRRGYKWLHPKMELVRAGFKGSARSLTLEGAFSLWEEYVQQAEATLETIDNQRRIIQFEALLADPLTHLHDLRQFCGLDRPQVNLEEIARQTRSERANAFAAHPELSSFYTAAKKSRWMLHYGYAEPDS